MDKTKSRDVSQKEIPATYKGILRISPNKGEDSPTEYFEKYEELHEELQLSDSQGTLFDMKFKPEDIEINDKECKRIVINSNQLNIVTSLNISSLLTVNNTSFLIKELTYPSKTPHDPGDYFYTTLFLNNETSSTPDLSDDVIDKMIDEHVYDSKNNVGATKVVFNERDIKRVYNNKLINEYERNDKILMYAGGSETVLTFENIETDIWDLLENASDEKSVKHREGRYEDIGDNNKASIVNALGLINPDCDYDYKSRAPKLGLSVPKNVIMYNAMPARRFLFHKKRLEYDGDCLNLNTNFLRDLIKEFDLCDGSNNTPNLFNYVQGAPTYLRGLNWGKGLEKAYKVVDDEDPANGKLIKNFTNNEKHFANYDYKIRNNHKHKHYLFYNEDSLVTDDELYKEKQWFPWSGRSGGSYLKIPTSKDWTNYITFESNESYKKTYLMRSAVTDNELEPDVISMIKNAPISFKGGTTSSLALVAGGHKNARKRRLGKCQGNYINDERRCYQDGGYKLAAYVDNGPGEQGWRGLTSNVRQNKYGNDNEHTDKAKYVHYGNIKIGVDDIPALIKVDDTLPCPPTLNLLPLIRTNKTTQIETETK